MSELHRWYLFEFWRFEHDIILENRVSNSQKVEDTEFKKIKSSNQSEINRIIFKDSYIKLIMSVWISCVKVRDAKILRFFISELKTQRYVIILSYHLLFNSRYSFSFIISSYFTHMISLFISLI